MHVIMDGSDISMTDITMLKVGWEIIYDAWKESVVCDCEPTAESGHLH